MTLRVRAIPFILIVLIALGLAPLAGQSKPRNGNGNRAVDPDLANARPGRDPNQAIDEEYTKKIKQYTTEAFFLSPLVDYLPASRTVPTPKAVLGDIAGAEGKGAVHERDPQTIRSTPDLRSKYDVIILGPGANQGIVTGLPLWRTPIPYRNSPETPNIGTWAQTDDTRLGMGLDGVTNLRTFIEAGGVYIGSNSSAELAINNNFTYGVTANTPGTGNRVVGSLLRTKLSIRRARLFTVCLTTSRCTATTGAASPSARTSVAAAVVVAVVAEAQPAEAAAAVEPVRPDAARQTIQTSCKDVRHWKART
jgi:hypothetical protein